MRPYRRGNEWSGGLRAGHSALLPRAPGYVLHYRRPTAQHMSQPKHAPTDPPTHSLTAALSWAGPSSLTLVLCPLSSVLSWCLVLAGSGGQAPPLTEYSA